MKRYDKSETARWTADDWQQLVGKRVSILSPAETVTAAYFAEGSHGPDTLVVLEFDYGGSWTFTRVVGETLWVEN